MIGLVRGNGRAPKEREHKVMSKILGIKLSPHFKKINQEKYYTIVMNESPLYLYNAFPCIFD